MLFRRSFVCILAILFVGSGAGQSHAQKALRFELDGKQQTILPVDHSASNILGFKPDGYMLEVRPREIKSPKVLPRFTPLSQSDVRAKLQREFGNKFEVTGTGSFLIVHPRGKRDLWANRFEELHRSMLHFFKIRGFPMQRPKFPLVGIVFHSRSQYNNYCQRVLRQNATSSYGMYTPFSNRIYLFDATMGTGRKSQEWDENLATVMHEAAHQTAHNTGVHIRGSATPAWLAEGLGCLFEARGIYDSFKYKNVADRINRVRLTDYRQLVAENAASQFSSIVTSDKRFRSDQIRGYAAAWALTFYLSERQPRDYIRYLKMVAKHEPFDGYSSSERMQEFTSVFGKNFDMLATRVNRFVERLPAK